MIDKITAWFPDLFWKLILAFKELMVLLVNLQKKIAQFLQWSSIQMAEILFLDKNKIGCVLCWMLILFANSACWLEEKLDNEKVSFCLLLNSAIVFPHCNFSLLHSYSSIHIGNPRQLDML